MKKNIFAFLAAKGVEISARRYFVDAMGAMAYGLFATLLVGTIVKTLGEELSWPFLNEVVWPFANQATGPAIALAIAYRMNAPQLVLFASAVVGLASYQLGGPLGVFISSVVAVECGKLLAGSTRMDIVLTPMITILVGVGLAEVVGPSVQQLMWSIGQVIQWATTTNPLLMGIVLAVVVGMVLTLPISSAALCLMFDLDGFAAGAATVGCCAQMIGFAVISYRDNGFKGALAIGIGTSMLQMPNIYKNWRIWIPPTFAAAVLGPLAILVFGMTNTALESGMGTCGFVGQIGTYNAMKATTSPLFLLGAIALLHFILPAILSYGTYRLMLKNGWIRPGDLRLP